jgi:hypothetical protein
MGSTIDVVPIMGIFGTGRSGSTWLGAIVGSHPRVAYRFEPLHRCGESDPRLRAVLQKLDRAGDDDDDIDESTLDELYRALLPAHPETEKPPFISRDYRMRLHVGRAALWPLARRFAPVKPLFRWLYTPRDNPVLVFKEVTYERLLYRLLTKTSMRLVYLVRHPAAVVSSTVKGQQAGLMSSGRQQIIAERIRRLDPEMPQRLRFDPASLCPLEIEALQWRFDVEEGLKAARASDNALVVLYEELCDKPAEVSDRVFRHFGLTMPEQTRKFIEDSTRPQVPQRVKHGEIGINSYFSVFRNPAESKSKWRTQMSADDQNRIMRLVEDSSAFAYGRASGQW